MTRLYTYYPKIDANYDLLWHVHESSTEQVIESFFFEEDARDYANFLEQGGGFAGFTPSFILRKMPILDLNSAFAMEFSET